MAIKSISLLKITFRNFSYWMMVILCISQCGLFLYRILIDIQAVKSIWQLGVPFEIALYSGILGIMLEYRPLKTQIQINHDRSIKRLGLNTLILLTIANAFIIICLCFQVPHS